MFENPNLQYLTVNDLAQKCAEETKKFLLRTTLDSMYCFELFRRAICNRDNEAWSTICEQYKPMVADWWVKPRLKLTSSDGDTEEIINKIVYRTYQKFWSALDSRKFSNFQNLKSLLAYLKMCVNSVIVDQGRLAGPRSRDVDVDELENKIRDPGPAPEEMVIDYEGRQKFWDTIVTRLHDEAERLVVDQSFLIDLKPREIYNKFPEKFADVDEVYKIKQNVIARLRRDQEFRKFLGLDD
jgi:hypothetical protein